MKKTCHKCKKEKPLTLFYNSKRYVDGKSIYCKTCSNNNTNNSIKTIKGLITRIYTSQKHSSKVRGHNLPIYTKKELHDWIISQPNFQELYDNWVKSNYFKNLKPSVDRLKNKKGYTLKNIRLVTWKENRESLYKEIVLGESKHSSIKVYQHIKNKKVLFHSIKEAERVTGIPNGNINTVCKGKRKTAGGFKWTYA